MANIKRQIRFAALAFGDGVSTVLVVSLKNDPVGFSAPSNTQNPTFAPSFDASKSLPDSVADVAATDSGNNVLPASISYSSHSGEITFNFSTAPGAIDIIVTGTLRYD